MDDATDVRELLRTATQDVLPPPGLLEAAQRGGRRRRVRSRGYAFAAAVAVVLAGAGAVDVLHRPAPVRFAGPLFDGRVHGDLAGDSGYLKQVVATWNDSHRTSANASRGIFDDLRGKPRVVWAGQTPAGKAAVVVQDAYVHRHGDIQLDHEGIYQLIGMLGPDAQGRPRLVGDTYPTPADEGSGAQTAWYVDVSRTVVAVVDNGEEHGVSYGWSYYPDGRAQRTFAPIDDQDGVGVAVVPAGTTTNAIVARLPYRTFDDIVLVQGSRPADTDFHGVLPWRRRVLLGGARDTGGPVALFSALQARRRGPELQVSGSDWRIRATTADGRQVTAEEIRLDDDPSHVYVLAGDAVIDLGRPDPSALLPVEARLPDGQGWLVAHFEASLEYRTATSDWKPAGLDAAVLPAGAVRVRVTVSGRTSEVTLPS